MMNTHSHGKYDDDQRRPRSARPGASPVGVGDNSGYGYAAQPASGKKQLEELIDLLYRRRWIVLVTFLLVAAGTVIYTATQTPRYSSSSLVMVNLGRPPAPTVDVPGADRNLFTGGRTLPGELYIIQNSYSIAQRVRERLREMHEEKQAAGELGTDEQIFPARGYATFSQAGRDVSAILVTATSPDPEEAARLANLYAEEYVKVTQEANRSSLSTSRQYLEEQEQRRRAELQQAEEARTHHLATSKGLALDPSGSSVVNRITSLETQRDQALINLKMQESSYEAREAELQSISPQLAQRIASDIDRRIAEVRTRLSELEAQKNDIILYNQGMSETQLAQMEGLNYAEITRRITQLRSEIERLSGQYVEEVMASGGTIGGESGLSYVTQLKRAMIQSQIEMDGLKAQIDVLNRYIERHEGELNRIPGQSLALARLQRDQSHAEQMYNFVVRRLQEVRISEESEPGYAHILRQAAPPSRPVYPDKQQNIILGLFFGLMAGLALGVVRDKIDNRIYKPEDLISRGYPVITTVPDMTALIKDDHKGQQYVEHEGHRYASTLVSLVNPMSTVAETYRQLRTRIQFSRPDVVVQTILVTSASPGEGKTITASNLAVTMAQAGRRTLLVDADLRRPRVHDVWGMKSNVGLVQLLRGKPGVEIENFETKVENLYVLPAGALAIDGDYHLTNPKKQAPKTENGEAIVTNPAELLGSKGMRDLLTALRDYFDVIILDTPPVLAAADGVLLSTQADATLVVARAGKTKEGEIDALADELDSVGATVIGMLLNGFDVAMAYGRKYRYQHYSKYGPYAKYGYYSQPKA